MKKIIYILLLPIHLLAQYTGGNSDGFSSQIGYSVANDLNAGEVSGSQAVCVDQDPVAFSSVQAAYGDGTISYQWEYSLDNTNWAEIVGATAEIYDAPELGGLVTAPADVYARRRADNGTQSKYSNTLVITVNDCVKYYSLKVKHSGKVLDVDGSGGEGSNVWQYESLGGFNQLWAVNDNGDGYFWLEPKHAQGQCLEIGGWSTADGGNAMIWTFFGNDNQLWYVQDAGEGYYRLINKNSDKSIEVENASLENMANVIQSSYQSVDSEKFTPVASTLGKNGFTDPLLPFVKGQALSENMINIDLKVSPNPFVNCINISIKNSSKSNKTYVLFDVNGRPIAEGNIEMSNVNIDANNFAKGIYILQIMSDNEIAETIKLVKQ